MNEGRTTAIFAVIAAVTFGLAWWSRPVAVSNEKDLEESIPGTEVFPTFQDPSVASSFKIVKFDEDLAQLDRFEVSKDTKSGMWRLPSFDDYPADAAEQVRDATTPLVSLVVLSIASFDRGDHSLYGVINPDDEELSVSESGVGMLVEVKGDNDEVLASLVIGKEVEQAQGQRYVRIPTEDAVYIVELDTAPFSTEFTKWIKGELLGVRSFDISNIGLRDYVVLPTQQGYGMKRNIDADLSYDASTSKWALDRMISYEGGAAAESSLAESEELNETALNDLRNAVQDLQIVGVRRKPTGLASDLKADKSLMENSESLQSLYDQGFFPQERQDGVEIFATGGETLVGTDDGVKYLLRFGEATTKLTTDEDQNEEDSGLRRYLLVTATLDDSKFPAPELQPVPETVEEMNALQGEDAGKEDESEEEKQERLEALKAQIAKENQQKLDERNEKIDEARKKVQELNARFADWYYVVSDSVYNKLTLSREQFVKQPESAAASTPDSLDGIELPELSDPDATPDVDVSGSEPAMEEAAPTNESPATGEAATEDPPTEDPAKPEEAEEAGAESPEETGTESESTPDGDADATPPEAEEPEA